ncbi:GGDEF domain-containing protein [Alkalimarinus coralli]|uniref:GGDEF domain-containing protein n=1 Tax=Alkalimarinus coralli TaxID=2935863 RepID=UPI00202BA442|nr:GGDEF domain-containing protein [Alkalimarinus coralli]
MSFKIQDINLPIKLIQEAQAYLFRKRFFYRFSDIVEAKYIQYMLSSYQLENRLYPILGGLGLVIFLIADHLVIPEIFSQVATIRALGAVIILSMVCFTYYYPSYRWQQLILCVGGLIIHLSLVLIGVLAANSGHYHYQFGPIVTIFFISNVIRVGFSYALPATILMFASQVFAITLLTDISHEQVTEILFIYSFVTIISLIVNGRMEFEIRKNFLRILLLNHEQEQLIKTQDELRKLSTSDSLTGLYNRRYFNKHIEREWLSAIRHKTPISVLMIDVDDFKQYNDSQGHLAGDDALSAIGKTLHQSIKRPDDLVARYGGEEFIATLPHSDAESAQSVAQNMLTEIYKLNIDHPDASHCNRLTISIGYCSVIPDQEQSIKDLLKCADDALYESKRKGKNCISMGKCSN